MVSLPKAFLGLEVRSQMIIYFDSYISSLNHHLNPFTPSRMKTFQSKGLLQKVPIYFVIGLLKIDLKNHSIFFPSVEFVQRLMENRCSSPSVYSKQISRLTSTNCTHPFIHPSIHPFASYRVHVRIRPEPEASSQESGLRSAMKRSLYDKRTADRSSYLFVNDCKFSVKNSIFLL